MGGYTEPASNDDYRNRGKRGEGGRACYVVIYSTLLVN